MTILGDEPGVVTRPARRCGTAACGTPQAVRTLPAPARNALREMLARGISRPGLLSLPNGFALFEKRAGAFFDVFGVNERSEFQRFEFERIVDREMRAVVDRALAGGDRQGCLRGDG